jgi:hypothetical protein
MKKPARKTLQLIMKIGKFWALRNLITLNPGPNGIKIYIHVLEMFVES